MLDWLFSRKLSDVVCKPKRVKVCGIIFHIRKIDALDFAEGSTAVRQVYQTYEEKITAGGDVRSKAVNDFTKIRAHYKDVIMAGVVTPELTRKIDTEHPGRILVDNLFTESELYQGLYEEIMAFTYGKKKIRRAISQRKGSWT